MKILKIYLCLLLMLSVFSIKAQVNLDSLFGIWNDTTKADTVRLKAMGIIAWQGYIFTDTDSAFYFSQLRYDFAKAKNIKKHMADALNTQGVCKFYESNYFSTLNYFEKSIKVCQEIGYKKLLSGIYTNTGAVYDILQDSEKALDCYKKALSLQQKLGFVSGEASSLHEIGNLYFGEENYALSLEYYQESLEKFIEIDHQFGIANCYKSIGDVYYTQDKLKKVLEFWNKSLEINIATNNKRGLATNYRNLGDYYYKNNNKSEALIFFQKSLVISEEIDDKRGLVFTYYKIGLFYYELNNFKLAVKNYEKSNEISKEIGLINNDVVVNLIEVYEKLGYYHKAIQMYKLQMNNNDSLAKMNAKQDLLKFELDKEYELKKQADSIKHADEIFIQKAEVETQKQRKNSLIFISILIFVSLGFVFTQLRKTRAQKVVIEGQHEKLNQSHQEITDSINYAKRIQDALMTSTVYMKDVIPESFIFFQPKDVVSGDFYWVHKSTKGPIYFTVADCTGHGVPGAFMSMIGTSLLNEFIIENNLEDTAEILTNMRKQIIKSLKQEGVEADNKDGMDMALCKYDPKKKTLQYSGAYNPLIHISNREINHIKADNQPVALHTGKKLPFTSHEIKLKKGDMLYIYSDGFADQFGGERGRKYMSGKFKKFLLSISEMSTEQQEYLVKVEFTNWMGENEQIDDVCVMGVRIT